MPDTETDTPTNADKMCTEPMEICISLSLGPLQPLPSIIIKPTSISVGMSFGLNLGLGHCKRTITSTSFWHHMCHGISIFPFGDLSAPGASLRPPALVTLAHDAV